MINVTIGESKTQSKKPFPKLMATKDNLLIVLFSEQKCGTVIVDNRCNIYYEAGLYSTVWDMESFTDFKEPITLQNT